MARRVSANDVPSATTPTTSGGDAILSGLVSAAFFARFYLPAEASAQGETLWIVGLWLVIGLVASLVHWRGSRQARRFDLLDGSVVLLIGGQIVSAVVVMLTAGHKRAAVNVAWEWLGVGVVWWLLRDRVRSSSFRQAFWRASIVTGVVLAGLGLWQHYVSQPQMAAEYGPLFDRLRSAGGSEAESIKRTLAEAGIPTEGPGLTLFEKRLRDSREPFGLFGLTNTLGGCLAVWLVLTFGAILVARQRTQPWRSLIPLVLAASLIAWCLLLTKSRTAWIGAACGLMVLLAGQLSLLKLIRLLPLPARERAGVRGRTVATPSVSCPLTPDPSSAAGRGEKCPDRLSKPHRRLLGWAASGLAALAVGFGLLMSLGGLDRQVLSEAPKSLMYRLQYWQATSRLIADHPWLGVGPGNFRQHYLRYKLPEASEEIADPHNLFLDVASTGGIFSALGLVALIVLTWRSRQREREGASAVTVPVASFHRSGSTSNDDERLPFWCSGLGAPLVFVGSLVLSGQWGDGDRLLILSCVWAVTAWLLTRSWPLISCAETNETNASWSSLAFAGTVTLLVHLLGAGGIAMPAVTQLLMILIACSLGPTSESAAAVRPPSIRLFVGTALGAVWLLVILLGTAIIPIARSAEKMSQADRLLASVAGADVFNRLYEAASLADPLSPDPWLRQAELAFQTAAADRFRSNEFWEAAVSLLHEAVARDPDNVHGPRRLGNWWLSRWQVTQNGEDAREAVAGLRRAVELSPTNAAIQAELAQAWAAAGDITEAASAAGRALLQDDLNRQLGHVDRYLPEDVRIRLRQVIAVGQVVPDETK